MELLLWFSPCPICLPLRPLDVSRSEDRELPHQEACRIRAEMGVSQQVLPLTHCRGRWGVQSSFSWALPL